MAGAVLDLALVHTVEMEHDLGMRKVLESAQRIGVEALVEHDHRFDPTPEIILRALARRAYATDRLHGNHQSLPSADAESLLILSAAVKQRGGVQFLCMLMAAFNAEAR
jgi:hypothetical protein